MIDNKNLDTQPLKSAQFDLNDERWWTPADIGVSCGITDRAVRYHCRRLFGARTRYRLTQNEAQRLCRYIRKFGLKSKTFSDSLPIP